MLCLRFLRTLARTSPAFQSLSSPQIPNLLGKRTIFTAHPPCRPRIQLPCLAALPSAPAEPGLDLLPKISLHPSLATIQVRNGPRNTYNPSHRVRKRRHGFLSRLKSRTGRQILKRRRVKRRSTLSH